MAGKLYYCYALLWKWMGPAKLAYIALSIDHRSHRLELAQCTFSYHAVLGYQRLTGL